MSSHFNTNPSAERVLVTNARITGIPGAEMLRQTLHDTSGPLDVLDNACGGGVITADLLAMAGEQPERIKVNRILAADIDQTMVDYVQNRITHDAWSNVETIKFDQQSVPLDDGTFSHIFNNFGIFFCKDDTSALAETFRLLQPGGIAAFTTWKKISWTSDFALPALAKFIPEAPALPDPSTLFPEQGWKDPSIIRTKLQNAGFRDVRAEEYSFSLDVEHVDFAEATAVLMKAVAGKAWAREEFEKFEGLFEPAILRYLRKEYPEGKWTGRMAAIISVGRKGK